MTLIGRYRLERELGQGAMGRVWQAHDLVLSRTVAVKSIHADRSDPGLLDRFRREAVLAAGLRHRAILTVYDANQHEGELFFVTEKLDGQNLEVELRTHPGGLPVDRVVGLTRQLAEALAVVHEHGIVHRDLKPGNLFVEPGDGLKVCDFGIAKNTRAPDTRIATERVIGTPGYIAPERWLHEPAGTASDLYSVGIILYEMLTGGRPFTGARLGEQHVNGIPEPPRIRNPAIPMALNDLTLRLLDKKAAGRPTAPEVVDVLRRIQGARGENQNLDGDTSYTRQMTAPMPEALAQTPPPATPPLATALLTRRVQAIGKDVPPHGFTDVDLRGADLSGQDLAGADLSAKDLTGARLVGTTLAGAVLRDGKLTAAQLDQVSLVGADLTGADLTGARLIRTDLSGTLLHRASFHGAALLSCAVDPAVLAGGGLAAAAVTGRDRAEVFHAGPKPRDVDAIAFSPDGSTVALCRYAEDRWAVWLWEVSTGRELRFEASASPVRTMVFSPDGA